MHSYPNVSLDDIFKNGSFSSKVTWSGSHRGVNYQISFHTNGSKDDVGTFCYYLLLPECQFSKEDFEKLLMEDTVDTLYGRRYYKYEDFPDVDFHHGVTFYDITSYWDNKTQSQKRQIKVGCDYAHYWDEDMRKIYNVSYVKNDAEHSINKLFDHVTPLTRSAYSGIYDTLDNFYKAKNGAMVHNTDKIPEEWDQWRPEDD